MSLPTCRRYHPAEVVSGFSQSAASHAAFALTVAGSAFGASYFRGHLCVHLRYGPLTRCHPCDGLVDRLQSLGFPPPCYPSYGASGFYPGRTCFLLNTPAFAGRTTVRADLPHTALQSVVSSSGLARQGMGFGQGEKSMPSEEGIRPALVVLQRLAQPTRAPFMATEDRP